ncbi:MAG: tetratricopeptide repeat protein [Devosiaceae bacterium]|nr:tetratricopeptide repeat protein [Devosiaceae bacterium]
MSGIVEMFLQGLPKATISLCPDDIKRKLKARLADFNPYHTISANHDLVRATRLAWVEACQAVFDEVQKRIEHRPSKETEEIKRFDDLVKGILLEIRSNAFERDRAVGTSPIDICVEAVINGVPELVSPGEVNNLGEEVTKQFILTLSELTGWTKSEIPEIYARFASNGIKIKGGGQARPFGELVFASFAEIIKNPNKYPEAKVAFDVAVGKLGRDIAEATLKVVEGLDAKFEKALANLDGSKVLQQGAVQYLELLPEIAAGVERIEGGVKEIKANIAEMYKGELQRAQNSLHASESDLISLLANLLEQRITRENIGSSLEIAYQKLKELRETSGDLAGLANEMPEIAPLLKQADEALQAGAGFSLKQAEQALAKAYNRYDDWIKQCEDDAKRGKGNQLRILGKRIQLAKVRFDFAEAEKLLRQKLEIRLELHGEEHVDTAVSYNGLAVNLNSQGKYAEAEVLFQKALQIRKRMLGEDHADMATSYNNLGANLNSQGKYKEAKVFYQKALQICEQVLGEEHPHTADSYNNLAANLSVQGKYEEAEPFYKKAIQIWKRALGEEHPSTALGYNNLALNLNTQGKYEEAELLHQKALQISERVLGEEHPNTATSYNNLATNLNSQGKYEEAKPLFQKSLQTFERMLGEEHPQTILAKENLANCRAYMKK